MNHHQSVQVEEDVAPTSSNKLQRCLKKIGRAVRASSSPAGIEAESAESRKHLQKTAEHGLRRRAFPFRRIYPIVFVVDAVGLLMLPAPFLFAAGDEDSASRALQESEPSFFDRQYLFGNWGGERDRLADEGVTFNFNNIGDFLTDVSGSQTHHATYFGRFRASTDIDFNKLAQFDGEFFVSGIWQYGYNLSGAYLHVNTLSSSIAGTESLRFDQIWYQQGFFQGLFKLKVGQIVPVNEFGETDFFDILFN